MTKWWQLIIKQLTHSLKELTPLKVLYEPFLDLIIFNLLPFIIVCVSIDNEMYAEKYL